MQFKISIFLPFLCCYLTSVCSQRVQTYYHYPVPNNPVNYDLARTFFQQAAASMPQRQVYQHYVPPQVARHYQPRASATNTHFQIAQQFVAPALENAAFLGALTQQGFDANSGPATIGAETHSLNVKLPLPLGIVPISVAPLPLSMNVGFDAHPKQITSYGTREVQRLKK